MVHLRPLPGAPLFGGSMDEVIDAAVDDANALAAGGCDGIVFENFGELCALCGEYHHRVHRAHRELSREACDAGRRSLRARSSRARTCRRAHHQRGRDRIAADAQRLAHVRESVDGAIVGTSLKSDGFVDGARVEGVVRAFKQLAVR
jgi:predicted TIM-barrel enzyme